MNQAMWSSIDHFARASSPVMLSVIFVFLSLMPISIPGLPSVAPDLVLMAVFHWAVYRPGLLPGIAVLAIGLLQDILSGLPLGLSSVIYVIAYLVVASQRNFFQGKGFVTLWLGFMVVATVADAAAWGLASVLNGAMIDPLALTVQWALTVMVFPVVTWVLRRWDRLVLEDG